MCARANQHVLSVRSIGWQTLPTFQVDSHSHTLTHKKKKIIAQNKNKIAIDCTIALQFLLLKQKKNERRPRIEHNELTINEHTWVCPVLRLNAIILGLLMQLIFCQLSLSIGR